MAKSADNGGRRVKPSPDPGFLETSTYQVEHLGPWSAREIRLRFDAIEFRPPAEKAGLIEETFAAEQAAALRRGQPLFNGKLARMTAANSDRQALELTLQPTDYKTFLASNLLLPEQFPPEQRSNAMGVSAVVRSADGRLMLGRRSERVAYNRGKLHTIGGVVDWMAPPPGGRADGTGLFDQLARELGEELGLRPEELVKTTAMALARDRRVWQPELLCLAGVSLSAGALTERWRQAGNPEHVDLWTCHDSPTSVAREVAALGLEGGRVTPIATAALLAYLAIRYGDDAIEAVVRP